ncbi:hypothetical protein M433DRAFT_61298 [Acidomyces richmondensis BFW]|nr:MAG: hypothetical protein FE78DRAFT_137560 [Acidomyces sp. 'richmondensis']KYG48352.1 hypothetical protein M433DRAFT_61298 [Acidomyces richmondensis BFW]
MFEKDIFQLIRGLRAHKGNEREYIQASLRECRKEIKSQDMDQKATALLKLVYLEMFGHDMSWASFNVLEVMSSQKYLQKRVGYLAAVQSFRPDTEVLMLAENLLKKDLNSPDKITIALPITAIPHVINPSMANSLLIDLLPKLSHSNPSIRKKTVVTLYRLALVYPETLRPAWPKIKERLLDENEDASVTAAVVNVVCELGWRRPQDFLSLAPRLFDLLTSGNNNWMAIKIIKLFSILIPLEPRLVKKLVPPLTALIKETPAMSLMYECINGIIQGGILDAAEGTIEGDEVARLCVDRLRTMLVLQGDPNLRYVALLAMAKITSSHGDLVAGNQDVILECIDDGDISIRMRALELVVDMINPNNLSTVVERLLKQLRNSGHVLAPDISASDRGMQNGIIPMADDDEDDMQTSIRPGHTSPAQAPPLPDDYRTSVIERILEMCSRDNYANMTDFEWYIDVLIELVRQCPASPSMGGFGSTVEGNCKRTVADAVGAELLNVAVRVKAVRSEVTAAAQSLLLLENREQMFPTVGSGWHGVLAAAAFIAGENASILPNPEAVLDSLVHSSSAQLPSGTLASYLQAIPKLFTALAGDQQKPWTADRRSYITLIAARIAHFLESLVLHPSLEVQERAVEYLDLIRLASEAARNQQTDTETGAYAEPPLLLTQAMPSLFTGMELKPVAPAALRQVPPAEGLDLNQPINVNLHMLLQEAEYDMDADKPADDVYKFYYEKPSVVKLTHVKGTSAFADQPTAIRSSSYQDAETEPLDKESIERRRAERRDRYRDDPYYIDSERNSGSSTPMHNILRSSNGEELDVDAIPVMELRLDHRDVTSDPEGSAARRLPAAKKPKKHFEIEADETLDGGEAVTLSSSLPKPTLSRTKKSLLEVDSSALSALSLSDEASGPHAAQLDFERRQAEEEEMAKAMKAVERLRLEMQRTQERIEAQNEATIVKRKKKKKQKAEMLVDEATTATTGNSDEGKGGVPRKKKKKKRKDGDGATNEETTPAGSETPVRTKRKKKRQVTFDE